MHDEDDLEPGTRVRLTPLGVQRCPKLKAYTGVIIAVGKQSKSYRVLIDGRQMPLTLHASYVESEKLRP
jgi:hypothetical protein